MCSSALQPLTGKLYTQFSTKVRLPFSKPRIRWAELIFLQFTFLSFLLLFEIGSTICGAALNSNMLIIGRAVAGLGGSGLVGGSLTIVAASIPMHKRPGTSFCEPPILDGVLIFPAMIGVIMSVSQIGIISGPLVGVRL